MTSHIILFIYDVKKSRSLNTYPLYQKTSRFKVFQFKISDQMSFLRAPFDNFEISRKKFENRGAVRKYKTDFQSENGLKLTKYRGINFRA